MRQPLVDRLRFSPGQFNSEAADEIERLKEIIEDLLRDLPLNDEEIGQ